MNMTPEKHYRQLVKRHERYLARQRRYSAAYYVNNREAILERRRQRRKNATK